MEQEHKKVSEYRTKLANGIVPDGTRAWCVHCDEDGMGDQICKGPGQCACDCHTFPRKLNCLCRKGILKCCEGCGCKCHEADWKLYNQTSKTRERLHERWRARLEKKRFATEGVHEWEKETLEYIMYDPTHVNFKYREFLWARDKNVISLKDFKTAETGEEFMKRMQLTPWGRQYIQEHPPIEVTFNAIKRRSH